uniref:NADH-ubiquinone oxidoreductase chain 3 n=1 Tax=Takydromus sylvaticus TaxID=363227 RepID=S4SPN2_9SAUR|nr:NADH dehydrogenase subunit 3 [Takydromus sylvaticus]AFP97623.1 NADH dehydrogenase subunit 3 [Takydromus sylvaticus]UXG18843.1 NADH dehydrogenase subunit 3 [Takydromus sylvaticus]
MSMVIMTLFTVLISMILMLISFWLPMMLPDMEKLSPYECGFDPLGSARLPFSVRFFLVAILFLLFDLEIALLLPTPWAINLTQPTVTFLLTTTIIMLLSAGLVYEWKEGGLDWAE